MSNAFYQAPFPINEPILDYAPDSPEKESFLLSLEEMKSQAQDICMTIAGEKISTNKTVDIKSPYNIKQSLGQYHKGTQEHVQAAIKAALEAKKSWEHMPWQDRAAIFLKAADLISGPYRNQINAATMLCQSKNIYQAEIDAVAEFADFLRFNVHYMTQIYQDQPQSTDNVWNRMEYRPLEGFIFALTPFNFTAIAGNLPSCPAMLGNTVVWKPAESQIYSAAIIMKIFEEAGLPAGVINLIFVDGKDAGDIIFNHSDFAGLHFTGSTKVFQNLWQTIGHNITKYKSYPRIVGETGGKDFVVAHPSANADEVATALARGAFEFQGQKCSAASRAYIAKSLWPNVQEKLVEDIKSMKMGSPEDFSNFINAVIDEKAFDKIVDYIEKIKQSKDAEILIGGEYNKNEGYFIQPTVVIAQNPNFMSMEEEIFGPVLTIYVYEDKDYDQTLELVDRTSPYALTGSVFAKDRTILEKSTHALKYAAGNFYINDKPTGAVVGQQPFGGARGSGTNDKAGSVLNLYRWLSPRTIKETFTPAKDYRYPFLG